MGLPILKSINLSRIGQIAVISLPKVLACAFNGKGEILWLIKTILLRAKYGYYTDAETGLILCLHRYYDPAAGRWFTRDPIGYAGGLKDAQNYLKGRGIVVN